MNISFLISAHNDPCHLQRLIKSLPDEAEFFVHIDAKSDIDTFTSVISDSRVHFLKDRYNIMWGSFGQVKYQMALIREALSCSVKPDYLISISGLDYPLWGKNRIVSYLKENAGKEFLTAMCLTDNAEEARLYTEYRFLNIYPWRYGTMKSKLRVAIRHIVKALGLRKPLIIHTREKDYKLYKGGSWWGITRGLAEEALRMYDNDKVFTKYFVNSFAPDETFIHTIAMNGDFAARCTLWDKKKARLEDLSPLTYIEYGDEIKVFDERDFDTLVSSGKMFCRKTVSGKSDKLIGMIDASNADNATDC